MENYTMEGHWNPKLSVKQLGLHGYQAMSLKVTNQLHPGETLGRVNGPPQREELKQFKQMVKPPPSEGW